MLKDAVRRRFDVAMVWAVDRLGRSLADLIGSMQELRDAKVDLFIHQQGLDTTTASGRAMFGMLGVFSEFERAMHCPAGCRGGVQALLMDEQVDLGIAQFLHRADQVRQRPPEPIDGPDHCHVKAATNRILQHQIELWPPLASLRAGSIRSGIRQGRQYHCRMPK